MKRSALMHFLIAILAFVLTVLITSLTYFALTTLARLFGATPGWVMLTAEDPLAKFGSLIAVTAFVSFPIYFIAMFISELSRIRSRNFHTGVGVSATLLSQYIFNSMNNADINLGLPIASIISGLAGGYTYWVLIGSQAGAWMPNRRPNT
ncbi:MAG: hypothetical protein ACRCU5_12115 [Rhizobiaceae bacterium]